MNICAQNDKSEEKIVRSRKKNTSTKEGRMKKQLLSEREREKNVNCKAWNRNKNKTVN